MGQSNRGGKSVARLFDTRQKSDDWKWWLKDLSKIKPNGLKVFSCFAGGGGSSMGYKLSGCDVVGCLEIDKRMNDLYIKNLSPKYNYLMDIREFNKLPKEELPQELFNLDILDGSPPCTSFSLAGLREDAWGKQKKFKEGQAYQTLDDLLFVFADTAIKLQPKIVIMENVKGLIMGNAIEYALTYIKKLEQNNYRVKHFVVHGENMGVPQTRHRVFFIAIRNDVHFNLNSLNLSFNYIPILYKDIKTGDGDINKNTVGFKWLKKALPTDYTLEHVKKRKGMTGSFTDSIVHENRVFPTLTCSGGFYRFKEKTKCTWEDYRNVSTFPQDYDFGETKLSGIQFVCGMSVPPIMIKRIVERIIRLYKD